LVEPKYARLATQLRNKISEGELPAGAQLPTEEQLCRETGHSRGTVRKAIDTLVYWGLVRRDQGRGTFVAERIDMARFFSLTSFEQEMAQQGRTPRIRVVDAEVQDALADVAAVLDVPVGSEVIRITRVLLGDDVPITYETRYMDRQLCPDLLDHDLEQESLHSLLVQHYHIPLVRLSATIERVAATDDEAKLLDIAPGATVFQVERLSFTVSQDGGTPLRPALWIRSVHREGVHAVQFHPIQNLLSVGSH
jgi:DNA-binding GntR family transcriptional regulator